MATHQIILKAFQQMNEELRFLRWVWFGLSEELREDLKKDYDGVVPNKF